ncbi:hypothetical protein [Ktedonospora formicarum]|uniref:Uncharacterized protein n=1 Tax=Ktedonospora formicarum TaxID=2778364 RepID=A0A8J3I549_9CHLR|nr:hypothetical protein [Ktedonospora formicarum]GHO49694.1 hypothetical protein KSX_78570 [Ktedonospora formicarum]
MFRTGQHKGTPLTQEKRFVMHGSLHRSNCSACTDQHEGQRPVRSLNLCTLFRVGRLPAGSGGWLNRSSPVLTARRLVLLVNASTPVSLGEGGEVQAPEFTHGVW